MKAENRVNYLQNDTFVGRVFFFKIETETPFITVINTAYARQKKTKKKTIINVKVLHFLISLGFTILLIQNLCFEVH